jgi:cytoskeletal protein CcmA (bactofilin family)
MFTKNEKSTESSEKDEKTNSRTNKEPRKEQSSASPNEQATGPRSCSYVGPKMHIKGDVVVDESLNIDGKVEGTIKSNDKQLAVGKDGHVTAEVQATTIEARGTIDGDVLSKDVVHLYSTAVVRGTIRCERLIVDDGAKFDGQLTMTGEAEATRKGKLTLASSNDGKTDTKAS